jgi:periplasmic copper chaperone A
MNPHRLLGVAAIILVGLAVASPALAHIDPDPTDAQAGSEVSVGFTVQHGCDGSPTVQLDMRLPDGVSAPTAEPPDGWTGQVDGNVVTFEGGPLPDDQELTFRVRMILPATPDTTIYFPFVQRCEVGEIRWIDTPSDGSGAELDEPAPAMQLFGPVATTEPAPSPTTPPTTTTQPTPTTAASSTTTVTVIPTTVAPSPTPPATTPATSSPSATDGDDGGSIGTVVFVVSIAAVGVVAAIVFLQSRRSRR